VFSGKQLYWNGYRDRYKTLHRINRRDTKTSVDYDRYDDVVIFRLYANYTSSVGNIAHWDYNGDGYMTKIFTRLVKRCEQCPQSGFKYDMWKQQSKYYCYTFEQYIDDIMTIPSWCKLEDLEDD
jgi:hypothetical protein